jgi:hypothetical protein
MRKSPFFSCNSTLEPVREIPWAGVLFFTIDEELSLLGGSNAATATASSREQPYERVAPDWVVPCLIRSLCLQRKFRKEATAGSRTPFGSSRVALKSTPASQSRPTRTCRGLNLRAWKAFAPDGVSGVSPMAGISAIPTISVTLVPNSSCPRGPKWPRFGVRF